MVEFSKYDLSLLLMFEGIKGFVSSCNNIYNISVVDLPFMWRNSFIRRNLSLHNVFIYPKKEIQFHFLGCCTYYYSDYEEHIIFFLFLTFSARPDSKYNFIPRSCVHVDYLQ